MSERVYSLRRHYGSSSNRSAGVYDSTYAIRDAAVREAASAASNNLRLAILRHYQRNANQHGGDIWDAAARCGMQP